MAPPTFLSGTLEQRASQRCALSNQTKSQSRQQQLGYIDENGFKPEKDRRVRLIRRLLQAAVAVFSLVPIAAGLCGMFSGPGMIDIPGAASLNMDSHFRYLSGLLTGIGIGFISCIPGIEYKTQRFQLLVSIVVLGGLGRLYSFIIMGAPGNGMLFGLGMELVITPLLGLVQLYNAQKLLKADK